MNEFLRCFFAERTCRISVFPILTRDLFVVMLVCRNFNWNSISLVLFSAFRGLSVGRTVLDVFIVHHFVIFEPFPPTFNFEHSYSLVRFVL